jgi:hypothetical protein
VSLSTVRWSELSAEHEIRYTGDVRLLVITMSKTSGVAKGIVWVSGWCIRSKDQTGVFIGIITQEFPPSCAQPRVPIHVFGVEVSGHQDRNSPPKQADRSAPISGREGKRQAARIFTS